MKLREVLNRRMVVCAFTGFASGLPLFVLLQLVQEQVLVLVQVLLLA